GEGGCYACFDAGPPLPPPSACPAAGPSAGELCSVEAVQCEYGNDPRYTCNSVAVCSGGRWSYQISIDSSCPTAANPPACPPPLAQASGACKGIGTACQFPDGYGTQWCACFNFGPPVWDASQSSQWQCSHVSVTGCPSVRPRLGDLCAQPNLSCDYGVCGI